MLIGLTFSNSFFSITNVMPRSVKMESFFCDSSRAIPSDFPHHPSFRTILTESGLACFFKISLIISLAFSVTSNTYSSFDYCFSLLVSSPRMFLIGQVPPKIGMAPLRDASPRKPILTSAPSTMTGTWYFPPEYLSISSSFSGFSSIST